MSISAAGQSPLLNAYSLPGRSELLDTRFGRRLFRPGYHQAILLLLWVLISIPIACYGELATMYLMCFRLLEGYSLPFSQTAAIILIGASTAFSVLILHTDSNCGSFDRIAMHQLIRSYVTAGEMLRLPDRKLELCS